MMDTPLLALTRRSSATRVGPLLDSSATETMRQLNQLRWIAVAGQLLTILIVAFGLGVPLPLGQMLGVAALLALANLAITTLLAYHRVTNLEIMLALLVDVASLTAQLYFSGGATNPFISLFLLQVVLGAILLEMWSAWVLVLVTSVAFGWLTIRGVPLAFPPALQPQSATLYMLAAWISFALTGTLLALFITRITHNLRSRDRHLADLRQQAVEEDGIVRMGLLASGAAHELGTPLASISVILSDWRRTPRLADDPELAAELADMQFEVERCKAIVTDVLYSAGEPRLEAMENVDAGDFLEEAVAAWRLTQPGVALDVRSDDLDGAALVADASLRQTIWNLLDNAAEAGTGGVTLVVTQQDTELVIAVRDRGPGFSEAQLATLGRPYQSTKGAGHGLGLFLAVNVARRLGGRLEAANAAEGGAVVRLILPVVPGRSGAA